MGKSPAKHSGFTILELAIAMTVVAFIIATVLLGNSVLSNATIRSSISQLQSYNTATATFRAKYGALPGDISNPADYGFAATNQSISRGHGNNNGLIEGCAASPSAGGETNMFWTHLAQSGLIKEKTISITDYECPTGLDTKTLDKDAIPQLPLGAGTEVMVAGVSSDVHFYVLAKYSHMFFNGLSLSYSLTPEDAFQLDNKMDDGKPTTGKIFSVAYGFGSSAPGGGGDPDIGNYCYNSGTDTYARGEISANKIICMINVEVDF